MRTHVRKISAEGLAGLRVMRPCVGNDDHFCRTERDGEPPAPLPTDLPSDIRGSSGEGTNFGEIFAIPCVAERLSNHQKLYTKRFTERGRLR